MLARRLRGRHVTSRRADGPRRAWRRFGGWTLRGRLLAALLAMLALICIMVSALTDIVTHRYLVGQVDATLNREMGRAVAEQMHTSDYAAAYPPFLAGQNGTVAAWFLENGQVKAGTMSYTPSPVGTAATTTLHAQPVGKDIQTVDLPGMGPYRVAAAQRRDGTVAIGLPLAGVNDTLLHLIITELCVTIAGLIAVGLVGESIIRRALRPLNRVATIATKVSEMELGRGDVALKMRVPGADTDPRTEVGQVGAALNRMLGHVSNALAVRQASEVRIRQFLADASHELRTPLAAIRGYAELTRHVDGEVPADVAYAMRRVESESDRMTTLVEDLLLLARLDAGRPLDRDRVDLCALMIDAISDAHVAGGGHQWRIDLPDVEVVIIGDGARLHQVLANLLTNARVHTPPGSTVTARLVPTPEGGAVITVADNGPGIPAPLLPEIFGRFARGDSSRSRAAGSTGLGLAIVSAVVGAHGGTVTVTSEPGTTVFTVDLPPEPPEAQPLPEEPVVESPPVAADRYVAPTDDETEYASPELLSDSDA